VSQDSFVDFLSEQLSPLGQISPRRMFGCVGVFCDGVMLGLIRDEVLYLRVDDETKAACAEAKDRPFQYQKQGKTLDLALWAAPDRLMDDPDELLAWARLALGAAHRVAARRAPKRSRTR
jgi:DNA transformation protein